MASSLPVTTERRTRRRYQEIDESEERKSESEQESESCPYKITGKACSRFVLSFVVLYLVLAVSIFSVFAFQDQSPTLIYGLEEKEVTPGGEASFTIQVKNPSILKKEVNLNLEKDLPSGWMASFCDENQCFFENCSVDLDSFGEKSYSVHVITDEAGRTGTVSVEMVNQGEIQDNVTFTVTTTKQADFTVELTSSERELSEVAFDVLIVNKGNVEDSFTVSMPPGVAARVSESTVTLGPGEKKELTVYIEGSSAVNTSLIVTSQEGVSKTLYLINEQALTYNFEMYAAKDSYIEDEEADISFDIINTGDAPDTYSVSATCLAPEWEVVCTPQTVDLEAKKSGRVLLSVKRGKGKSASVIATATSTSGLSKNIKLNVFLQETQGKTVLAEYFTGTWCYVCSYGEKALRQLAGEVENLIVLVYHLKDDIETPGSARRAAGLYGFSDNVSTLVVNGTKYVYYSSGGEGAIYFKYKKIIEEMMAEPLKAEIYVSGRTVENVAYITAKINSYTSGTYDVYFVLFKNNFEYRGEVKQYIVRDVADPQRVTLMGEVTVSTEFILPAGESYGDYGVVVIIQDPRTLEVLQATQYML
jgi:thiol-disulfide isomerase/thioredoxin